MRFNVFLVGTIITSVLVVLILVLIPKRNQFSNGWQFPKNSVEDLHKQKDVEKLYEHYCASCHGVNGAGDTKYSELTNIRMPSFLDEAFQKNWTNVLVQKAIGQGTGEMPGFANKLTSEEIYKLADFVLKLGENSVLDNLSED
ncbi:MAG: cytochrome c [Silvanigrellaceae bacterium]|nr:cytochrome c [Silvanigrellaceae bacterium]